MSSPATSSIPTGCNSNLVKNLNQKFFSNLNERNDDNMNTIQPSPRKNAAAKHALKLSIPKPSLQLNNIDNNYNNGSCSDKKISKSDKNDNSVVDIKKLNEVEKMKIGERNVDKLFIDDGLPASAGISDASGESLSATLDNEKSVPADNDISGALIVDDLCSSSQNGLINLPTYPKFESDLRRRIDEMNSPNKFDMHVRGKQREKLLSGPEHLLNETSVVVK